MHTPDPDHIADHLLEDFYQQLSENYQRCEQALIELEQAPGSSAKINDLLRSVAAIKDNLTSIGLHQLCPLLQSVEDLFGLIRSQRLEYDDTLSDVILLTMDKTRLLVEAQFSGSTDTARAASFIDLCMAIQNITASPQHQRQQAIVQALHLLKPEDCLARPEPCEEDDFLQIAANKGVHICDDIRFINNLVPSLELRSGYWQGKTHRSAQMALQINEQGGSPVPAEQLLMAALFHDLGMSFLPLQILHKAGPLSTAEHLLMEDHVYNSCHLLSNMNNWETAMQITRQHHERCDGSGYPERLHGSQICAGAKILAITDTFDACRYARAYRTAQKRPFIRAIAAINLHSGSLFDDYWVAAFNQVVKRYFIDD